MDTNMLIDAHKAYRGSKLPRQIKALQLLKSPQYKWVVTPTAFKEFVRVETGSASAQRFLRHLEAAGSLRVMKGGEAAALAASPAFRDAMAGLKAAANRTSAGMRTRLGDLTGKSYFADIVQTAVARASGIPYAADNTFFKWVSTQARSWISDLIQVP